MPDRSSSRREALKFKKTYNDYRCILDESYFRSRTNILKPALHWDFDLFTLERLTAGFPLLHMATYVFEKNKFLKKFGLDFFEMQRTLKAIEDLYHETNPYHNALHATDVAQASYCLLKELRVKKIISSFDFMCSILAALCHDIDHPGVNQSFILNSRQMLAMFYKFLGFLAGEPSR
uniref:High affinity cAMP-specific 3',5'-cyclic phosphodiesterase 7A n=1 Tax=Schistocephalus solidus TaxID=70667 RepID=A0A0V0J9G8_SCHSO